jgi:hypothetical protein
MGVKHGPTYYGKKKTLIWVRDITATLLVSANNLHTIVSLQKKELQEAGFQYATTHSFDNRASSEQRVVIYTQKYFGKRKKE